MSLPACFASADQTANALRLVVLDRTTFPAWLAAQPAPVQAWLNAQGFNATAGTQQLVPRADGELAFVAVGIGDAGDPLALSHLPALLPAQWVYRLDADSLVKVDPSLLLLGWGLGAYRFERYLKTPKKSARLLIEDAGVENTEAFALLKASTLVRPSLSAPIR
jgi:leucyl aminopeptidase